MHKTKLSTIFFSLILCKISVMGMEPEENPDKKVENVEKNYNFNFVNSISTGDENISIGGFATAGRRPQMEDVSQYITEFGPKGDCMLFAIFDGHAGKEVAKHCANWLYKIIQTHPEFETNTEKALIDSFENFNKSEIIQKTQPINCGSCAIVVIIKNNKIYSANLGDSKAILCKNGKAIKLSNDHSVNSESECERVIKAGGYIKTIIKEKNIVKRFVVDNPTAFLDIIMPSRRFCRLGKYAGIISTPEIMVENLDSNTEFLILGCDGIFEENMTEQDAVDIVRKVLLEDLAGKLMNSTLAAKKLVEKAYDRQSGDNLSAIVVGFNKPKTKALARLLVENNDSEDVAMAETSKFQKTEDN